MKRAIPIGIFLMAILNAFGQKINDTTEITNPRGTVFRQNGKRLTQPKLIRILQSNSEAIKEYEIAVNKDGTIIGMLSAIAFDSSVGYDLAMDKICWIPKIIGVGLVIVTIHIKTASIKHEKNAVRIYNYGLKQTGFNKVDFKIGLTCNGIGIKTRF